MEASHLQFVEVSPTLKNHIVINKIVEAVVNKLNEIPQLEKLQRNMDLVLFICNTIEALVFENGVKNQPSGYKKDLAIRIFDIIRWNKPEDKDFLVNAIEFLHSSGRIKKVKLVKRVFSVIKNYLKSESK